MSSSLDGAIDDDGAVVMVFVVGRMLMLQHPWRTSWSWLFMVALLLCLGVGGSDFRLSGAGVCLMSGRALPHGSA